MQIHNYQALHSLCQPTALSGTKVEPADLIRSNFCISREFSGIMTVTGEKQIVQANWG
jgi:hypothetical protein